MRIPLSGACPADCSRLVRPPVALFMRLVQLSVRASVSQMRTGDEGDSPLPLPLVRRRRRIGLGRTAPLVCSSRSSPRRSQARGCAPESSNGCSNPGFRLSSSDYWNEHRLRRRGRRTLDRDRTRWARRTRYPRRTVSDLYVARGRASRLAVSVELARPRNSQPDRAQLVPVAKSDRI